MRVPLRRMNVVLYHDGEGGADSRESIRRYEFFFDSPRIPRSMYVPPVTLNSLCWYSFVYLLDIWLCLRSLIEVHLLLLLFPLPMLPLALDENNLRAVS